MAVRQAARPRTDLRNRLLRTAVRILEKDGPEALQARSLTARVGTSTQAIYTYFGGMPGLLETIVADGFAELARHVAAIPETADPVADFFAQGWAYTDWARAHQQLYRLMFGLTGGGLRLRSALEMTELGALANFPEGQAAAEVMVRSLDRVKAAGRIRPVESVIAAAQFLSATHGFVLLEISGTLGAEALPVMGELGVNLMAGLGDSRDAAQHSLAAAVAART